MRAFLRGMAYLFGRRGTVADDWKAVGDDFRRALRRDAGSKP